MISCVLHDFYGTPFSPGESVLYHRGPFSFTSYLRDLLCCQDAYGDVLSIIGFHFLTHANITLIDGRLENRFAETRIWHNLPLDCTRPRNIDVRSTSEGVSQEMTVSAEVSRVGVVLVFNGLTYLSAGKLEVVSNRT